LEPEETRDFSLLSEGVFSARVTACVYCFADCPANYLAVRPVDYSADHTIDCSWLGVVFALYNISMMNPWW